MVVKFEVQARKKPKLNRFMDVADFQMILLSVFVIPFIIWYMTGVGYQYTWVFGIAYIAWMIKFKVDKPDGYWDHWVSFKLRGKTWTLRSGQHPPEAFQNLKNN